MGLSCAPLAQPRAVFNVPGGAIIPQISVTLPPGSFIFTRPGAMQSKSTNIKMETTSVASHNHGLKWHQRLWRSIKLFCSQRNAFINKFFNDAAKSETMTITPNRSGVVMSFDFNNASCAEGIVCQNGSFLAANGDVDLTLESVKGLKNILFSGQGLFMQKIMPANQDAAPGTKPQALLQSHGQVTQHLLAEGESLDVDTKGLLAMTGCARLEVVGVDGGLKNKFMGGEGFFNTRITGPGTVWVETFLPDQSPALITRMFKIALPIPTKRF